MKIVIKWHVIFFVFWDLYRHIVKKVFSNKITLSVESSDVVPPINASVCKLISVISRPIFCMFEGPKSSALILHSISFEAYSSIRRVRKIAKSDY